MKLEVTVEGGDQELISLYAWLQQDSTVHRNAHIELLHRNAPVGEMGGIADLVSLITDNAWSAASFAVALSAWRQARPSSGRIVVRRGNATVTLENGTEEEVRQIVAMFDGPDEMEGER